MTRKLSVFVFFISVVAFYSCKKEQFDDPANGSTGNISLFNVSESHRSQTSFSIKWTKPVTPIGTTLKYKLYLSNVLLTQDLIDTNFIITNLQPNQTCQGRVVAYTSSNDTAFARFDIPLYSGPANPYSYLNGYYRVSERENDFNNIGDSNSLTFTGRIEAYGDSSLAFYQSTRTPSTWWGHDFVADVFASMNDSLIWTNYSVRGKILDPNTIKLTYIYGFRTTAFNVKQTWTKLQNPSDSINYSYQWPPENNGLIKTFAGNDIPGSPVILGDGGQAVNASLNNVTNFYMDAQQNAFITCSQNSSVRMVNASGVISTIAGNHTDGFSGDGGLAIDAQLNAPSGVVTDASGNIYISDAVNRRIRMVNRNGIISTFAGTGQNFYSGEGQLAVISDIGTPGDLANDQSGNLYFITGSRVCKINLTTGILSRVAGTGNNGYSGDGGLAIMADLSVPSGITLDQQGNLYIADYGNNVIRKVNSNGIISTIVGMTHFQNPNYYFTDGVSASSVKINVYDVAIDDVNGSIYISSGTGGIIFKVNSFGKIFKYGGYGTMNSNDYCIWNVSPQFYNGDNGPVYDAVQTARYGIFCKNSILYGVGIKRIRKIFL
jgi:hypothetical protein